MIIIPDLALCMMLLLNCRAYLCVCYSLKLVNFGLIINCSDSVQAEYNRVGPGLWGGFKIYYFLVWSGSGCQKPCPQDYTAKLLFHQSPTRHSDYHCDDVVTDL